MWHVCVRAIAVACVLMCVHVEAVRPGGAGSVGLLDAHASLAVSKRVLPADDSTAPSVAEALPPAVVAAPPAPFADASEATSADAQP